MSAEDIAQAEERSQHQSIVIDKVLYTWGGGQPDLPYVHDDSIKRKLTSRIKIFHISTGIWKMTSTTGSPPLGVKGYSCSVIDEQNISFFGGWCGHDYCHHNSLCVLNTKGFHWKILSHTTDDIPVMRRGYGGMITVEDHDGIKLLTIGGRGPAPTIPNQQFKYIKTPNGRARTNEVNLFTPSTGKWSTPTMIGDVIPPNSHFSIENLSKSKAIIFGGLINEGYYTSDNIYILEIINSTVHWQNIKSSQSMGQWSMGRQGHASSIINNSVLAVLGGLSQNQLVNDKCLWLYSIDERSWTKIDLPDTVSGRYDHSLSSLMIGPHCVWFVVLGGHVNPEKRNVNGVDKWFFDFVSSPNISMIIELMFSDGHWSLGFVLDDKSIHLLELIYKDRLKHHSSNDEMSLEEQDDSLKELRHSLYKDLETSQQTIKSLQEALLDTKEELNKQVKEKDSYIAKMTRKHTHVNELEEKNKVVSKLIRKLQKAEELREKKQDEESKHKLEQDKASIANSAKELKRLKESNKLIDDDKSCKQLVHDIDCQFALHDVSKLMVILQPVEDDWYQLGHNLDMEESTLRDIKQTDIPMEYLLQRWCSEGGTLMKLEKALTSLGKTDLISSLRQLKSVMKMDVSVQFNYMIPSIDNLDYLSEVHKAAKKLFIAQGDGHPQLLNWEEYGLQIGIPKGALMFSETTEIAVVALVGGQFKFPKRTQLVSAVYAISVSKPLVKPLRLDMQHCVNITRPSQINYLKFAIASVDTPSLPYQFEVVKGGEFTVNSFYGSIHRQTFSFFAIVADEADILPVPFPDDSDPTPSTTDDEEEEEHVPSGDDTNGQEEEGNGSTSSSSEEENGCTNSDDESTQSNESQTHEASGSVMVNENEEEVKIKPIQSSSQESNDEKHYTSPAGELLYAGIIFDEGKQHKDFVTFATTKHLNALLMYIKENHPKAETGQCIQFSFQPSSNYIELIFDDSHQDDPCTGWIIRPQLKPCRLLKIHIDNFGNKEPPVPVSCLISVYSIDRSDTVPVLNYGIPLEGVDPPVTIFIHRALRTTNTNTPSGSVTPSLSSLQSSLIPPSLITKDQLKSIVGLLKQILKDNSVDLHKVFQQYIGSISREMSQCGIIGSDVQQSPSYDAIIGSFEGGLLFKRTKGDIERHCVKFLKALVNTGGPVEDAALMIQQDWIELVRQELSIHLELLF